jgi:hypothetical protein
MSFKNSLAGRRGTSDSPLLALGAATLDEVPATVTLVALALQTLALSSS